MNAKSEQSAAPWIDPDDAPEITAEWVAGADLYEGQHLVRRGRPPVAQPRTMLSMRVDAQLLAHLRGSGKGWQTRVHAVLQEAVSSGRL